MDSSVITPDTLASLAKAGGAIDLIDVRSPAEYQKVHVEFARNIPLDQLDPVNVMRTRRDVAHEPLYVVCQSGQRGQQAREMFRKAGFTNVVNVEGGTLACVAAGLPVVREKTVSLERQVRIAAGSLVLAGVISGWLVHPAFFAVSAFVARVIVRGDHRHVRYGPVAGPHALEPSRLNRWGPICARPGIPPI